VENENLVSRVVIIDIVVCKGGGGEYVPRPAAVKALGPIEINTPGL